jgi:hypothetical protein
MSSKFDQESGIMMEKKRGIKLCICKMCPSFLECNEEIGFCLAASGKSACITEEKGCLCPGCPVLDEEGFQHAYYCTHGSEPDQL